MSRLISRILFPFRALGSVVWLVLTCIFSYFTIIVSFKNLQNNRRFAGYYGPIARWIVGFRVDFIGKENWGRPEPCIYVVNHQSMMDFPIFARIYPPNTVLIAKKSLFYIPFFGLMYVGFGNILIDRKNRANSVTGMNEAVQALRERGASILIFPEGTRNSRGGMLPFKKGAFYMAVQAQVPIVPIVIPTYRRFFDWKTWTLIPARLTIEALPPISTKGLTQKDVPALLERTRDQMLRALDTVNDLSVPR